MTTTNAAKHHEPVQHNTNAPNIARPCGMLGAQHATHHLFDLFSNKMPELWLQQLHWLSRSVAVLLGVALCVILREHLRTKAAHTGHKEVETKSEPAAALPITCLWCHVTWRSAPVGTLKKSGSAPVSKCQNPRESSWDSKVAKPLRKKYTFLKWAG